MNTNTASPSGIGTLLIVDDEESIREILAELLSQSGATIKTAQNGAEALQIVKSGIIDAVITDIKMPIMTGLQFLAEIRGLAMQTPVVVLTGYGDKENFTEALRLDATDFLEKPFNAVQVSEIAKKALAYGKALREMEAELEALFQNTDLPADQVARIKRVKRITAGMKFSFSTYANPANRKAS